ncbi:uncharacterized protein SEPMUDRAFT_121585 [Sphaerulina musiva SO2202]|uniref:Uncharacterized protein n=1 Tax=Sphaerulina musiva (strain SO2202) TaxID=692275 RepID=M3CVA9_SPHMS|nr:uncharacterized protein SEPMUDRAFT_121585 [Sphaerulina musiva SO2202]EMF08087.1 hypothetical protein SEPMUDRAFT_121585 [Sphaerulina musiva SO2202]
MLMIADARDGMLDKPPNTIPGNDDMHSGYLYWTTLRHSANGQHHEIPIPELQHVGQDLATEGKGMPKTRMEIARRHSSSTIYYAYGTSRVPGRGHHYACGLASIWGPTLSETT